MPEIDQKAWKYIYQRTMENRNCEKEPAVADGRRTYSYGELFRNVKKYAAVFSALGMTGKARSRVGLVGTGAAETVFAFYGLNMTGAEISLISSLSVLKGDRILQVVRDERLTDLIVTDEFIREETFRRIVRRKDELGLRFILLLHLPICGCTVPPPLSLAFEQKSAVTRAFWGPLYMDFLTGVYGSHPISYDENVSRDSAFIIHTSGTTGGSGSPIVMSDRAINSMCRSMAEIDGYDDLKKAPVTGLMVDLSNAYGIIVQVHFPLSLGGEVVTVPVNALNPFFYRAVPHYGISVLFLGGMIVDMWLKYPETAGFDFSSVKLIILGGTAVSAADKRRYLDFFRRHGCKDAPIINGYGISELGGVCALSTEEVDDESVGFLMKGFEARFFDEDTEKYLTLADAPCSGVLYLSSDSMTSLFLDGKQIVPSVEIDGRQYVCSNDLVRVDRDGRLTYLGRSNRYFLHGDGVKYQSGLVETEIARQPGIGSCGIVPVFDKPTHDNIPMLCVSTVDPGRPETEVVREALLRVFRDERTLEPGNLPLQLLIAAELPRNANGKIDLYKINQGEVEGRRFRIEAVMRGGLPQDVSFRPMVQEDSNIVKNVYRGIAKDIFEESVPGRICGDLRQAGAALSPADLMDPMKTAQSLGALYRTYCSTMMNWAIQMYQTFMRKEKGGEA